MSASAPASHRRREAASAACFAREAAPSSDHAAGSGLGSTCGRRDGLMRVDTHGGGLASHAAVEVLALGLAQLHDMGALETGEVTEGGLQGVGCGGGCTGMVRWHRKARLGRCAAPKPAVLAPRWLIPMLGPAHCAPAGRWRKCSECTGAAWRWRLLWGDGASPRACSKRCQLAVSWWQGQCAAAIAGSPCAPGGRQRLSRRVLPRPACLLNFPEMRARQAWASTLMGGRAPHHSPWVLGNPACIHTAWAEPFSAWRGPARLGLNLQPVRRPASARGHLQVVLQPAGGSTRRRSCRCGLSTLPEGLPLIPRQGARPCDLWGVRGTIQAFRSHRCRQGHLCRT